MLRAGFDNAGALSLGDMGGRVRAYYEKVMGYGPLVHFPQWEPSGAVSQEIINGWNGAYVGVTLGQPGIGDGNLCPWFDGINDYNDIFTLALQAAFNGGEGTAAIWGRVNGVGVWTDGVRRHLMRVWVDANNAVDLLRPLANNTLEWRYEASTVVESVTLGGLTTTDWFHMAITWSISAGVNGEMRAYYQGAQTGLTQVALGAWVGVPGINTTLIGAGSTIGPQSPWHGWLAHPAIFPRALPPAEIADLAVI